MALVAESPSQADISSDSDGTVGAGLHGSDLAGRDSKDTAVSASKEEKEPETQEEQSAQKYLAGKDLLLVFRYVITTAMVLRALRGLIHQWCHRCTVIRDLRFVFNLPGFADDPTHPFI